MRLKSGRCETAVPHLPNALKLWPHPGRRWARTKLIPKALTETIGPLEVLQCPDVLRARPTKSSSEDHTPPPVQWPNHRAKLFWPIKTSPRYQFRRGLSKNLTKKAQKKIGAKRQKDLLGGFRSSPRGFVAMKAVGKRKHRSLPVFTTYPNSHKR